ncbi:hypothetical protein FACUT_8209 [Fusarium acutatum]|uniref:DDE-1 domain-containing protein n=1 Tax=Fusarium acutatum TaxID=78861 RepID=A0A8H4JNA6_9HYPO|nr:hypothetical protein FACUT_8209 [Fusarium acutatum]
MANRLLDDRDAPRVGSRWAMNFVKRQPLLKIRFQRRYDYQRAKCEDPTIIRNWFRLVQNTIAKYGIHSDDIWNFDETGFMMGVFSTMIQAINAAGWAIEPFIVVAGQNHLQNWYQECNIPGDWAIATTQNGWTDNGTGLEWLKHFNRCSLKRTIGTYRLLILDGHESHHSVDFELYCKENNIITLCVPPHSSHLLQPLDVGCFGPLKRAYGREIEHLIRRSITHITKTQFFPAFYAAHQAAITENPNTSQRGYKPGSTLDPKDTKDCHRGRFSFRIPSETDQKTS